MRRSLRSILVFSCAALVVGACGGDDGDDDVPAFSLGSCIKEDAEEGIEPVPCESDEAEALLVYDIAPEGQYRCDVGLKKVVYGQELNGTPTGVENAWCVGTPGELTGAQQDRLDQAKAEDEGSGNP